MIRDAESAINNCERFADLSKVSAAKLDDTFGHWLNSKAIFAFQSKQWMIKNIDMQVFNVKLYMASHQS
tara:strand:+ start:192 stop:398 length:207 start_codon:yes stop_codon:yes gene_type:complete